VGGMWFSGSLSNLLLAILLLISFKNLYALKSKTICLLYMLLNIAFVLT